MGLTAMADTASLTSEADINVSSRKVQSCKISVGEKCYLGSFCGLLETIVEKDLFLQAVISNFSCSNISTTSPL